MNLKALMLIVAMCVVVCLALALLTSPAYAKEKGTSSGDKELQTKQGLDSLATKEFDKDRLPGKLEFGIVIGSFFAMIAAFKWI